MKTLVGTVLATSVFLAVALAVDTRYKTRFITSATQTIHVRDGVYLTITNFTQDNFLSGQRGVVVAGIFATPTPAPTAAPTPTPTLSTNAGPGVALSTGGKLTDTATLFGDIAPTGTITFFLHGPSPSNPLVDTETVTVNGNASYTTPNGFSPTLTGTYTWSAFYSGDGNNNPATDNGQNETEIVTATPTPTATATPTPTPISGTVLAASIIGSPRDKFIKPIVIAGPAIITIDAVPPDTLSITYRKSLQPSQPTPTPTPTPIPASTSQSSATTTLSSATSIPSSQLLITTDSPSSDEDDIDSPTPNPTPTPTPTPTATSSVTATPSPTPTPTPTA